MKAKIKKAENNRIVNLKETFGNPEDVTEELNGIIKNFEMWLNLSSISEEELYCFSDSRNFSIGNESKDGYMIIRMFADNHTIGETIAYPLDDEYAKYDAILLILYIASRLDEHDHSERKDYFYNIAKCFCNDTLK